MAVEKLKLIYKDPRKLKGYERNAKTHSKEQVIAIRASLDRFGPINPILLKDDGKTIGAGHGRQLAALLEPALATFPTITMHGLTEAEWRAYVITDNKLAEVGTGWDLDLLKLEMEDLRDAGFDTTLTGFSSREMLKLLGDDIGSSDPDEVPPAPADPVTQIGEAWLLDKHRILCGDSTSREAVEILTEGVTPDLTLSDPPYGIGYGYSEHDDKDNEANARLVQAVFDLGPAAKVWTPGPNNLARDLTRFGPAKVLCWHKGFAARSNGVGGASTWEPVLVVGVKRKSLANDYLDFKTDHEQVAGQSLRDLHPCPKPVALFAHLAEAFCPIKGIIYEPFSGSGTTLLAAEMTDRTCFAMEITPAYVDVAIARWQAFTGKEAVLATTGQTFAAVQSERQAASKPAANAPRPRRRAKSQVQESTTPEPGVAA